MRIGCVRYLNTLPFYHQLDKHPSCADGKAVFHKAVPAELNRLIREGQLDIALVSSLEYARHPEHYQILPGLCIGAGKFSESVLLISKVPLLELTGKTVVLSEESLSSQILLKVLFSKLKIESRLVSGFQAPEQMLKAGDACLLIGDGALAFDLPKNCYRYDLSSLWNDMTGLPFCFALWVVRREFAEGSPELVREFLSGLQETFRSNMKDKAAMLAGSGSLPQKDLLSCDRYFRYLSDLYFEWNAPLEAGLVKYYEFAKEIGELEQVPELEYFEYSGQDLSPLVIPNKREGS